MSDQLSMFPGAEPAPRAPVVTLPAAEPADLGTREADVILLDYVFTLVANSHENRGTYYRRTVPYTDWIDKELYREWLIGLLRGRPRVILITARPAKYAGYTLRHLEKLTGWAPEAHCFNAHGLQPPQSKRRALHEWIYSRYGKPAQTAYLALESNIQTRKMYAAEGIAAVSVPRDGSGWTRLPRIP